MLRLAFNRYNEGSGCNMASIFLQLVLFIILTATSIRDELKVLGSFSNLRYCSGYRFA